MRCKNSFFTTSKNTLTKFGHDEKAKKKKKLQHKFIPSLPVFNCQTNDKTKSKEGKNKTLMLP